MPLPTSLVGTKIDQSILSVNAEKEPIASHIIFKGLFSINCVGEKNVFIQFTAVWYPSDTAVNWPACYLLSHEKHIDFDTYPMVSIS